MHGFIHTTLRSLLISRGGEEMWESLLSRIGCKEISFLELKMHEDSLTVQAVATAAELLGIDVPATLLAFGEHFVVFRARTSRASPVLLPNLRGRSPSAPPNPARARAQSRRPTI